LHLVDTVDYASTNCFQRQLTAALQQVPNVTTVPLQMLGAASARQFDRIVCCLKQRTLHAQLDRVANCVGNVPVVVYDQDVWHAYMDGSPYVGTYERAMNKLNVKFFAITSQAWIPFLGSRNVPTIFVPLWTLPELCNAGPLHLDRSITLGFLGGLHPHRRAMFDELRTYSLNVRYLHQQNASHDSYLRALRDIRMFIRSEDRPITVGGEPMNLKDGLWGRDVEVASQGCFSIRNAGVGSEAYLKGFPTLNGQSVVYLYERIDEVPDIVRSIETIDPIARQDLINRTIEHIKGSDRWRETADTLTSFNI
jgi:hypothetical protein